MATLIEQVRSNITPDIVQAASVATGESESATRNTINAAIPSILAGTLSLGSTTSGADRLTRMVSDGGYGDETISRFRSTLGDATSRQSLENSGSSILSSLFGTKTDAVTDAVAQSGNVKRNSASKLMRFAAPVVMAVLGKQITTRGLDSQGVVNMLSNEKNSIIAELPPGVGRILGLDHEPRREKAMAAQRKRNWGPAVVGALVVIALLFLLARRKEHRMAQVREVTPPAAMPSPAAPSVPSAPGTIGTTAVVTYLAGTGPAGRAFVIQDVTFVPGSSQLTPEGKARLAALATAMKSHPTTVVRIAGTTETGSASQNQKLSKARADAVKSELAKEGVKGSNVETQGMGEQNQPTRIIIVKK